MKKTIQIVSLIAVITVTTLWSLSSIRSEGVPTPIQEASTFLSTKKTIESTCTAEANARVEKKFNQSDSFDLDEEEYLRTYWHDNYYGACLFSNGIDADGKKLPKTTIEDENGKKKYTNRSMNIAFELTGTTDLVSDNNPNPDFDKHLYTSLLKSDGQTIGIQVKKTFTDSETISSITEIEDIRKIFFTESNVVLKTATTSAHGIPVIEIQQDDALFGIAFLTPEKDLVFIYGKLLPKETLKNILDTLSFPNI